MLPSDENTPAVDMSQPANLGKDAGAPLQNPLHDIYRDHLASQNGASVPSDVPSQAPVISRAPAFSAPGIAPTPSPLQAPLQPAPQMQNDPADETIWIQRTKSVVEQTQNDPYKRLQMIQQLQAQYQSEHFRKDNGGVASS